MTTTTPTLKALTLPQVEAIAAALDMDPSELAIKLHAHIKTTGPTYAGRPGELHHISRVAKLLGLDQYEALGAVNKGELRASNIEGRMYCSTEAVEEYVARLHDE